MLVNLLANAFADEARPVKRLAGHSAEKKLNLGEHPTLLMYRQYVDDTFSITATEES